MYKPRKTKYTVEVLSSIVGASQSMAQVIRSVGLKLSGGNYRMISHRIRLYNISTSHFTGMGWAKGKTAASNVSVAASRRVNAFSDAEVFCVNSPVIGGQKLRKRLIDQGVPYRCKVCGISDWLGGPLPLHIDHENGIHNDNRLTNIRFLCPNCHQQTISWGNTGSRKAMRLATLSQPVPKGV